MTAQVPEQIIINGEQTSMTFCPPIPNSPDIIIKRDRNDVEEDIKNNLASHIVFSTACWRRYIGTWEIKDDKFYLNKLEGCINLAKKEPIHATWFTGVLRIPQGKMLHYVHMGFGSIYEKELHVKIESGIVTAQRTIDNTKKIKDQTQEDRFMEGFRNLPGLENRFDGDDF